MTLSHQQALLSLALHAAMADGTATPAERQAVQKIALRFQQEGVSPPSDDPAVRDRTVKELAALLRGPVTGLTAYEMALTVCEADPPLSAEETTFLAGLRAGLGLDETFAADVQRQTESLYALPAIPEQASPPPMLPAGAQPPLRPAVGDAELEQTILNNSILAGALELLPSSLATMAIVPLQMRLVFKIGQAHGYELDRGHIKDLLATLGVGLTSQVVEGFLEKAARGLFGALAGGLGKSLGGQAASSGLSFATTYALGQLARQYYSRGRTFSALELRELYDSLVGQGKTLQTRYLPQIQDQARNIDVASLTTWLKGS